MAKIHMADSLQLLKPRSEITGEAAKCLPRKAKAEESERLCRMPRSATANNAAPAVGDFLRVQKLIIEGESRRCDTKWWRVEAIGKTVRSGNYVYMQDTTYYRVSSANPENGELAELLSVGKTESVKTMDAMMTS
jgi:hypothetical protein